MSTTTQVLQAVDQEERWLYRVGGASALLLALGYIITIPLYVSAGAPPTGGGEAWLAYLAGKTPVWWAILALSVLTDLLYVPVGLSLYLALKALNRNAMLLATAFVELFVILDLAVTWPNYASLITLAGSYASATNAGQRAAYVAAAGYASTVLGSRLEAVYSIGVLSVGILIIGSVMLRSVFGRTIAYIGVATGILGIVAVAGPVFVPALSAAVIITSILTTLWLMLAGYRLYRLGQQ